MKEIKKVTVDGKEYTIYPMLATKGYTLFQKLLTIFGPGMAKLLQIFGESADFKEAASLLDQKMDLTKVEGGIVEILASFKGDPNLLIAVMKEVLDSVNIGETNVKVVNQFDTLFMGDYFHGLKLTAVVIKEQYGDFLSGAGGLSSMLGKFLPQQ